MESTVSALETKFNELLFICPDTKDPKLQFILLIHAALLTHDLRCTGRLEDDPEGDFLIPENWTQDTDDIFSFRYYDPITKDTIYVKFVCEGNLIDINAVTASKNDKIISTQFNLADYQALDTPTIHKIYNRARNEFLVKLLPHLKPAEEPEKKEQAPIRVPFQDDGRGLLWNIPRNDQRGPNFGDYGRSDLYPVPNNPLGGINSGGNLLGPRNPIFGNQNLPGSHPVIRYDPTGPDDIDPTTPDPDINLPPVQIKDPRHPFGRDPFGRDPFGGGPFGGGGGGHSGGGFGGGFGGGLI